MPSYEAYPFKVGGGDVRVHSRSLGHRFRRHPSISCRMAFSHALAAALGLVTCKSLQCHSIQRLASWGGDGFIELIPLLFAQPLKWKVSDGHFTASVKHPILPPPVMPVSLPSEPPLVVDVDNVLGCIQSFPKGTSCGRDGLRAQHILDAFCGEGRRSRMGYSSYLCVVNLLFGGECPKVRWISKRRSRSYMEREDQFRKKYPIVHLKDQEPSQVLLLP
ncbi:hypothetical protein Tco_0200230 [Tanacetum coccineum]